MTTTGTLGNYGANLGLAAIFTPPGTQLFLGLHVSTPNVLNPSPTEVAGGGYARQPITFAVPSSRSAVSITNQNYAGMPAATINFLGVWTTIAAGLLCGCIDISATPLIVLTNGYIYVPAGDVAFSF